MLLESSEILLISIRKKQEIETERILNLLGEFSLNNAILSLETDESKNVFWVNIYNAFFQLKAKDYASDLLLNRRSFFLKKQIHLFGRQFSFDQIEHQFLRKSKWKYGFGFIRKPFIRRVIRNLSVVKPDYRIHFVLNCGANGCPIIRPLNLFNLNETLELSMLDYLKQEVFVDELKRRIKLNQLFLFYLGDFGGKKGLKKILLQTKIIDEKQSRFKFKFTTFDKTPKLNHFVPD